jgi:hypothetical protein
VTLPRLPDPSSADPCVHCPWRLSNQGKPHPDGWYTRGNLARLWSGLRHGEAMSCHPTDPGNVVSEAAQAAGYRPAPPGTEPQECRGAVILQQREMHLLCDDGAYANNVKAYRKGRPAGLLRDGISVIAARLVFGGVPFLGGRKMARPNLNHPDVGYHRLPWEPVAQENDDAASPA